MTIQRLALLPPILLLLQLHVVPTKSHASNDKWHTYRDPAGDFQLMFPTELTPSKTPNTALVLSHSVAFKHLDPCDMSDAQPELDRLVDFRMTIEIEHKGFATAIAKREPEQVVAEYIQDGRVKTEGLLEPVRIAQMQGYQKSDLWNGCGDQTYYFPLAPDHVIVLTRRLVAEFNPNNPQADSMMALPGLITPSKAQKMFEHILSTFARPGGGSTRRYRLTKVALDDSLNVRAGAGTKSPIVGAIPADGSGVIITGPAVQFGRSQWVPIIYKRISGWVNQGYLRP